MATKTFWIADTEDSGFNTFQEDGVQPADAFMATNPQGWIPATVAAGNTSQYQKDTERASTTFTSDTTTPKPPTPVDTTLADALRTPNPLSGTFASGTWDVSFAFRSQTQNASNGRIRFRVWRGVNANGTSLTQVTSAVQVCSTVTNLQPTITQFSSLTTWNPGALTLSNEYLYFQLAWEITTAGGAGTGSANRDVNFYEGTSARIITPDFTPTQVVVDPELAIQRPIALYY